MARVAHLGLSSIADVVRRTPAPRLRESVIAAMDFMECVRLMARNGSTSISEVMGGANAFTPWTHFPEHDVVVPETASRFYYHGHPMPRQHPSEHGHFHVFLYDPRIDPRASTPPVSHLGAIAVDARGLPVRLFTTNRWVTGERWVGAATIIRRLGRFQTATRKQPILINCLLYTSPSPRD